MGVMLVSSSDRGSTCHTRRVYGTCGRASWFRWRTGLTDWPVRDPSSHQDGSVSGSLSYSTAV